MSQANAKAKKSALTKSDRCGKPVNGRREEKCVKPIGHRKESVCATERFWCGKHDKCRLSPHFLCFDCVLEALNTEQRVVDKTLDTVKRLSHEVEKLRATHSNPSDESKQSDQEREG